MEFSCLLEFITKCKIEPLFSEGPALSLSKKGWGETPQCIELDKKGKIPFRHLSGVEMRKELLKSMKEFAKMKKEQGVILPMNLSLTLIESSLIWAENVIFY